MIGVEVSCGVGVFLLKIYEIFVWLEVKGVVFVNWFELVCYSVVLYVDFFVFVRFCFEVDVVVVKEKLDRLLVWEELGFVWLLWSW